MPPFIQQPHSLYYSPARIPTFDHGLQQTVFVRPPVNGFGARVKLTQFWLLRKAGGVKWEYYCSCTPPADRPGIPVRFYDVKKKTSPYFGNVYLGCGKTKKHERCQWKIRLDKIYKAHDVEIRICPSVTSDGDSEGPSVTSDGDSESPSTPSTQLVEGSHIENEDANVRSPVSSPRGPSAPLNAEDRDFDDEQFNEAFTRLMAQLQITGELPPSYPPFSEQELAELLEQLGLNKEEAAADASSDPQSNEMVWNETDQEWQLPTHAYEELCAAFAGQDDVLVTPDGAIHYIPKGESQASDMAIAEDTTTGEGDRDDDMGWADDETTLMDERGLDPKADYSDPSEKDGMFVDLTLDADQPSSRKPIVRFLSPIDLTMEESSQDGMEIFGAGTSAEPYEFADF
ncbi:hypothetical protein EV361DRAFT_943203 [Lentinula raphanica]|nr:hypothetical protein EV361DRAFT_943203 [Lentinula raphanica]